MSKITFRADDDLIRKLEAFDASKSEVMREALRSFLAEHDDPAAAAANANGSVDDAIENRVDDIIADRVDSAFTPGHGSDITVNVTVNGESVADPVVEAEASRAPAEHPANDGASVSDEVDDAPPDESGENAPDEASRACSQCGEDVAAGHVYCPNCGEKASHRVFCECGDELRTDWAFCPGCGRRTPAADVLDQA